jgi:gamma-glutamyltranspeptidase/glutathione hydrolase
MFTTRPEILGTFGVVASTHWLASATGMGILERGGNAFDAAVAAGMVLQVAEPHLNGPGGDMPLILHEAKTGETKVICGQGSTPAGATIEHYRGLGLEIVPGTGLLATCIPGVFDAWMLMLRDYGTMRPEDVFEAAIGYAENGVPLVPRIIETIETVKDLFETEWLTSAAQWLPGGNLPKAGTLLANRTLAATWRRLLDEAKAASSDRIEQVEAARRIWAEGFIAGAIDRFCRENEVLDASGGRHKGVLTGDDMAGWRATYEDPLIYDYHGYGICKCGPWSQGPTLLQGLSLMAGMDVAAMDPLGSDFVHTVVECMKLTYADREAWYGDPEFVDVPVADLLSAAYADARRALIGDRASLELRPGSPGGREPQLARFVTEGRTVTPMAAGAGEPTVARYGGSDDDPNTRPDGSTAGDTCHLDIIDRWGNMVSATPSGGWLQSSPLIPELGFVLGSRAQMFWLEAGLPASLAPGKRPRTTLTPSFVLRGGEAWMPFGTPGGDQQDQWQLIMLLRHLHHGLNLQEAIDIPSFHTEHFPSSFYPRSSRPGVMVMEGRWGSDVVTELRRRGHEVEVGLDWSEGRLTAAKKEDGLLKAAANPRGMQGYAVGR